MNDAGNLNAGVSMSGQEERKEKEYIHKLIGALDKVRSSLSEIGLMELRRKRNTVSAIIRFVRPMFYENLSLQKKLEARRKSRVPLFWFFATVVVVHLLDYSVPDTSRWFDFTVGKIVGACSYVIWLIYNWNTERMERRLKYSQQALGACRTFQF
jgi:hypothetical protein